MAHFARIEANLVTQVVVIADADAPTESAGSEFCRNLWGGDWIQTSYNGNLRKNFAGIGYTYEPIRDAFIPPKPYPSWKFVEESCQWAPPVEQPTDGVYRWDEITVSWVKQA